MINNDKLTQQISSISNSEIENYNIQDEIYKFTESVNSEILKYNDKIFAKNQSELLSLLTMIKDYKAPIQFGNNVTLPKMWFDNPTLKQYATDKFQEFETLTNPETNTKLQATNIVDSNLTKVKDLLSQSGVEQNTLDAIKSVEDLANNISLPDNFNIDSLKDLMKTPNLDIPDLESLAEKLNIPDFKIDVISSSVSSLFSMSIGGLIQGGMSGINFNRMSKALAKDMLKEFPEGTDWPSMVEFNAKAITKAVMTELSKMTFYIEPGEIKVLTNGSPSTHQGQNVNRIKIKLK